MIRLIATREVRERMRSKAYWFLTALLVVATLGAGVVARLVDSEPGALELVVAGAPPADFDRTLELTAAPLGRDVELTTVADADAARQALEDDDSDVAIVVDTGTLLYDGDLDQETEAIAQLAWTSAQVRQSLLGSGLTPEQLTTAFTVVPLAAEPLDGDDDSTDGVAILTGSITAVLLFLVLQTFGNHVLLGVAEEKSSAVVEVLLARVRADQLLAGKVIGIGIAALVQYSAGIAAGLVALGVSGVEVPSAVWSALPMAVGWFLGGYALYATLLALAGSLASRQEDAQSASAPIMTVMVLAYILIYVFGYVPESTTSMVLSLVPVTAPFLMPMRTAAGAASVLEVVVAAVLLAASVFVVGKLAGRIYEQVVLRRGGRIAWGDALKLGRSG